MCRGKRIDLSRVDLVAGVDHPERSIRLFSACLLVEEEEVADIGVASSRGALMCKTTRGIIIIEFDILRHERYRSTH